MVADRWSRTSAPPFAPRARSAAPITRPVTEILREIERASRTPLARSRTNPADAYTSADFFAWEVEHVFHPEWLCVGHASQVPEPGNFVNLDLLGEPLTIVRGADDEVRVLSRVCPHRGMDIMPEGFGHPGFEPLDLRAGRAGCGQTRSLLCPYHHWSFELDGRLKGCTEMQAVEGFRREDQRLAQWTSEVWEGFVFVNPSGDAGPVRDRFASLLPSVAAWQLGRMRTVIELAWECPFNWKVMIENWTESYHHLGAHHRTLHPMMPARDTWTEAEQPHFIRAHLPYKPALVAELKKAETEARDGAGQNHEHGRALGGFRAVPNLDETQKFEWGLYLGFPCFMLLVAPDRALWYRLQPIAHDRCRLLTTTLITPEAAADPDIDALLESETRMLRDFHLEDMQVCTGVQRGLGSSAYAPGRLSHLEMPVWLIQRYLAARGRGTWPTLDRPGAPGQR
jgi:phenylpropionate dioxygenase-like ring-hydroxylating dioxygenase large terminal subunit